MGSGDQPIRLDEPQFIHGEAVEIAGITSKNLNNWTQRGVIQIGHMHRTGRRMYSILDLIELRIVGQISEMVGVPPSFAAAVAKWARDRALQISERGEDGKLLYKGLAQETRHYLTIWIEDGEYRVKLEAGHEWIAQHSIPHPMIVVPLDDLILRIENLAAEVLEREYNTD